MWERTLDTSRWMAAIPRAVPECLAPVALSAVLLVHVTVFLHADLAVADVSDGGAQLTHVRLLAEVRQVQWVFRCFSDHLGHFGGREALGRQVLDDVIRVEERQASDDRLFLPLCFCGVCVVGRGFPLQTVAQVFVCLQVFDKNLGDAAASVREIKFDSGSDHLAHGLLNVEVCHFADTHHDWRDLRGSRESGTGT